MKLLHLLLLGYCLPAFAELTSETLSEAEAGDAEAQYTTGMYYLKENKEENHLQLAKSWFEKSAKQNHVPSLYEYGFLCLRDKDKDAVVRGVAFMSMAADKGYAEAQYQIGLIRALRSEFTEAIPLFEKAAAQYHTGAMVLLAQYYDHGFYVSKDPKKANELVNKAIELGDTSAKNLLGRKYAEGVGVKKDPKKAFELYSATAASGNAEGQYLLADCYRSGMGTKKNYDESVRLARMAIQNGKTEAAGALAVNYLFGYGVKKNPTLGYALLKYCGKGCNADVRIKLVVMTNEMSELEQMAGDQLSEKMSQSTDVLSVVDEYEKSN
jgi:uncharacterized protein